MDPTKSTVAFTFLVLLLGSFKSAAYGGLVTHYRFEGGTNGQSVGSIQDSSANGLNGDVVGDLRFTSDTAPFAAAGGTALDATSDFSFGRVLDDPLLHPTGDFTLELFANPRYDVFSGGGVPSHTLVHKQNFDGNGTSLSAYAVAYNPNTDKYIAAVSFGSNNGVFIESASVFGDNQWRHIAATYDVDGAQTTLSLYVDSVLEGQQTFATQPLFFGDEPLYIGAGNYGAINGQFRRNFIGYLDEIRISDEVLSTDQFLTAVPEPSAFIPLIAMSCLVLMRSRARTNRLPALRTFA